MTEDRCVSQTPELPLRERRALSRSPRHAGLRDGRRPPARGRMGNELCRTHSPRHAGLRRVRTRVASGRLDRRQVEPGRDADHLLRRHRGKFHPDRAGRLADRNRLRTPRNRRLRLDLPPRWDSRWSYRDEKRLAFHSRSTACSATSESPSPRCSPAISSTPGAGAPRSSSLARFPSVWAPAMRHSSGDRRAAGSFRAGPETVPEVEHAPSSIERPVFVRVLSVIVFTAALGGLIYQSTTFALPKIFDERLAEIAGSAAAIWRLCVRGVRRGRAGTARRRPSGGPAARCARLFAFVAGLQAVFFALMHELTGAAAVAVAAAFAFVVFGQTPINDVLVSRIARSEWRSRAYSIRYVMSFLVMASSSAGHRRNPRGLGGSARSSS